MPASQENPQNTNHFVSQSRSVIRTRVMESRCLTKMGPHYFVLALECSVYLFISEAKSQVGQSGSERTIVNDGLEQLMSCLYFLNAKISRMCHHTQFGLCTLCDQTKDFM